MIFPQWLAGLFGKEVATPTDTSSNLNKKAHSELIENILMDRPLVQEAVTPKVELFPISEGMVVAEEKLSLEAELARQAGAYELSDTEEMTANKSHESQIKAASNFALAEMLTELRLQGQGVQERWYLEFSGCLAEVQKNRAKCEKELLGYVPPPAVIDRMKFLAEVMIESHEKGFEPTKAENLYGPLFEAEGKQTWEKAKDSWKDPKLTEKQQYENQNPPEGGPGREEKDPMERQAPRSTTAGVHDLDDIQLVPQDKYLVHYTKIAGGETYYKWFTTPEAAEHYMTDLKTEGFTHSAKLKDFSKDFKVSQEETVQKKADIPSPWKVVKKDGEEVIARITPEEVLKESKDKAITEKRAGREYQPKCPHCGSRKTEVSRGGDCKCWACNSYFQDTYPEKQASLELQAIVAKMVKEVEAKTAMAITAAEEVAGPAESLEGLTPQEQELWKKYYRQAFQWAASDPIARRIGKSEARRAAMMALLRSIRSFNPQHESEAKFETYLFRAVHNELLTMFAQGRTIPEKEKNLEFVQIDQPISEGDQMYETDTLADVIKDVQQALPEENLERSEQAEVAKEVVERAKQQLSGKHKEVFDLLTQGYNITEIAQMMQYTIPNVVRYRKALATTLEKIMGEVLKHPVKFKYKEPEETPEASEASEASREENKTEASKGIKSWQALENTKLKLVKEIK